MGKRTKLEKFAENLQLPNVFENYSYENPVLYKSLHEPVDYKGKWNSDYFKNQFSITLELACGGGEYCLGLSELFPQKNFIGIDIKGARIWKGAKKAFDEKKLQIAFVRTKIELIPYFFDKGEIGEIWITFPDPFLNNTKSNRRLTSPPYLTIYKNILADGAILHLKTDDDTLYHFTLKVIAEDPDFKLMDHSDDIYNFGKDYPEWEVKTYYELKHLGAGKKIKYIRFRFGPE